MDKLNINVNVNGRRVVAASTIGSSVGGAAGAVLWFLHLIAWKWIVALVALIGGLAGAAMVVHDSRRQQPEPEQPVEPENV